MRGCAQLLALVMTLFGAGCLFAGAFAWLPFVSDDMRLDLVGVIVFLVTGSAFYLAGKWLDRRVPPEKPKTFVLKPGDTRFIGAMLNRTRRIYLILGLALLVFDSLMVVAVMQPEKPPPPPESERFAWIGYVFGGATMLLIGGVAVLFIYQSFRLRNAATRRLHSVLTKTPDQVTGLTLHFYQTEGAPGTLGRQIMAVIEVENERLRTAATLEQCVLLKQYVQLHSPHAAYQEVEHEVPLITP